MLSKKRGFTLMELITVTVIITILSTISYTSYRGYHRRARVYEAKRDLSSIVSIAEVFRANTGFYLPNLREMHVPIKGRHSYNYKVICNKGGSVLWETRMIETDICGDFAIAQTTPTPPDHPELNPGSSCADPNTKCWMGAVLCHNYSPGAPISCGSEDYTLKFESRGVMQWKSPNEDWSGSNIKKEELAPFFNIVDFASGKEDSGTPGILDSLNKPHCKRIGRNEDILAESSDCFFAEEYAVDSASIESIIRAHWIGDEESFISTPSKLVVTALACKEKQTDCGGGAGVEHSIIRMDTNRLVDIIQ